MKIRRRKRRKPLAKFKGRKIGVVTASRLDAEGLHVTILMDRARVEMKGLMPLTAISFGFTDGSLDE